VTRVGVFADETPGAMETMARTAGVTCLQLHGDETPEACRALSMPWYKAHRVGPTFEPAAVLPYGSTTCLLDTRVEGLRGGTGECFDWGVAFRTSAHARVILAGGLTPANVGAAIAAARPYAVDVNSGVERAPGRKDRALLAAFMDEVRRASLRMEREA
jgi:phosphoribosylanthranilate isomerase